ncbi:MAG: hypothetical protein H6907_18205 [Hyphomicrobiales bacterium]|nr:hypothetical protein [Hyphomicrobiales bacterium]MCP5373668.1 hypothetical protein [Hyphomicrobiales bacterium]
MNETLSQILSFIPGLWRRRWQVLILTWLVCVLGWAFVSLLPDRYVSTAKIYVDTDSLLRPLLRGMVVETNTMGQVELMQRTLTSRPNLEKIARMTDLDLQASTQADTERLLQRLRSTISVRRDRSNLFTIGYRSSDPQLAQRVVQALLTIFVEGNIGTSRRELDAARQFIDEQLRIYEEQMTSSEQRLTEFRQRNMAMLPGGAGYYKKLQNERGRLAALQAELADLQNRGSNLRRQLAETPEFIEIEGDLSSGGPTSGLQLRILDLQTNIDNMLLRYTEKHPDVIAAKRLLDTLKKQYEEELAGDTSGPGGAAAGPGSEDGPGKGKPKKQIQNQIYQNIKLQLVNVDAKAAELRGQIERQNTTVGELKELANRVPEVEAELTRLQRDHNIVKRNYEKLLSRKESAIISENRESKGEEVQFRIIEPPQVPVLPTGVKRSLMLTAVLGMGIAAGVGLITVLVMLQTTFFSTYRLMQVSELPVIGSVSMIVSSGQRSLKFAGLTVFALACFSLAGTYGGLMIAERNVGLPNLMPTDVRAKVIDVMPEQFAKQFR